MKGCNIRGHTSRVCVYRAVRQMEAEIVLSIDALRILRPFAVHLQSYDIVLSALYLLDVSTIYPGYCLNTLTI